MNSQAALQRGRLVLDRLLQRSKGAANEGMGAQRVLLFDGLEGTSALRFLEPMSSPLEVARYGGASRSSDVDATAAEVEAGFYGGFQDFEEGTLLWASRQHVIYAMFANGTWQRFHEAP